MRFPLFRTSTISDGPSRAPWLKTALVIAAIAFVGCGAAFEDSAHSLEPSGPVTEPTPAEGEDSSEPVRSGPAEGRDQQQGASSARDFAFGFWNLENLFDTIDDPTNSGDDEFLPAKGWDDARYGRKIARLAEAIERLEVDLLGVCEVENQKVLDDLVAHPKLAPLGFSVAHLDSPDKRGIDMALLYRAPFTIAKQPRAVHIWEIDLGDGVPKTRGIFEANVVVDDTLLTVLVNHWPSRRGGERSVPHRRAAAETARKVVLARIDAAKNSGREGDVLLLGDFNDDPYNDSLVKHLEAVRGKFALRGARGANRLYNPSWKFLATPDLGTLYYSSGWNVFDQAIVSRGLLDEQGFQFVEGSLSIAGGDEMRNLRHPAHPPRWFRKYKGNWDEGFSDHFAIVGKLKLHPPEQN